MLVTFRSLITLDEKEDKFEFTAPLYISKWEDFDVYEFKDPSTGSQSRIEVAGNQVNIMAAHNTINLSLGQDVNVEYASDPMRSNVVYFISHLINLNQTEDNINFTYTLSETNGKLIAEYNINLDIKKEA